MSNSERTNKNKRQALKDLYPSNEAWAEKVDAMTLREITDTYLRLKAQNRL